MGDFGSCVRYLPLIFSFVFLTYLLFSDGTFASGDSLGNVKFWDSLTGTQLHSFIVHGADVLCLTVGQVCILALRPRAICVCLPFFQDGNTIYSSGVDQKICQFSKVRIENSRTKSFIHKWVNTGSRRVHCHDVRTIGAWPSYAPVPSNLSPSSTKTFLASGGLDMSLVICPISGPTEKSSRSFSLENLTYERLPYKTSFSNPIQLARQAKLILCRRSNSLTLWRFNITSTQENGTNEESDHQNDWEEILEMELQFKNNLVASAISNDGAWIAVSSLSELKLFRLIDHKVNMSPIYSTCPHSLFRTGCFKTQVSRSSRRT